MTFAENYQDWLRDAYAMEKQAEKMLSTLIERSDRYPQFRQRLEQHLIETRHQITLLDEIFERNNISHSIIKDTVSKLEAFGMASVTTLSSDEIVKNAISSAVFEQLEVACYTTLITAARQAGDLAAVPVFESILQQEKSMAEWALRHLPDITDQFLLRSAPAGAGAKH